MSFSVRVDDLSGPEIAALLDEHLADMHVHSPAAHVHALDLEHLRAPDVTVWTVWDGATLAGCGALRQHSPALGEVKSMRTASAYRRRGVGRLVLETIIAAAGARGLTTLSLETGTAGAFEPARALYRTYGFRRCAPFGPYRDDGYSQCWSLSL